jgi:hypothetical protein
MFLVLRPRLRSVLSVGSLRGMNPNTAITVRAPGRSVFSTLPSALTSRGHRVLLHRGSFLVNILPGKLRAPFLLWTFLSHEVYHHAAQIAERGVLTGTIHPRIVVPIVPTRDVVQGIPEN